MNIIEIRLRFLPKDTWARCEVELEYEAECFKPARYRMIITSNGKPEFTKLMCMDHVVKTLEHVEHTRFHMDELPSETK